MRLSQKRAAALLQAFKRQYRFVYGSVAVHKRLFRGARGEGKERRTRRQRGDHPLAGQTSGCRERSIGVVLVADSFAGGCECA